MQSHGRTSSSLAPDLEACSSRPARTYKLALQFRLHLYALLKLGDLVVELDLDVCDQSRLDEVLEGGLRLCGCTTVSQEREGMERWWRLTVCVDAANVLVVPLKEAELLRPPASRSAFSSTPRLMGKTDTHVSMPGAAVVERERFLVAVCGCDGVLEEVLEFVALAWLCDGACEDDGDS